MARKFPWLVILVLLVAWSLLSIRIGAAWFGHQETNGAWISLAVRNYQLHGFRELNGLVDTNSDPTGAVTPYTHHPPLIVWLSAALVLPVGYSEALLRFLAAGCTLISAAAFYGLARRLAGQQFALWCTAFYLLTPMMAYFGRMPDHEAPALMFTLLFALVLVSWLRSPTRQRWWLLAGLVALTAWTAWGGLVVIGMLCVMALFYTRRRLAVIMLGVVAVGAVIALLGYYQIAYADAIPDLINTFIWRSSASSLEPGSVAFTASDYVLRVIVRLIVLYTPAVCLLALVGVWLRLRRRGLLRGMILAWLAAGLAYILLFRNASYIHDYYLIYLTPGLALLAGAGVALIPRRAPRLLRPVVMALAVVTLPATIYYLGQIYRGSDAELGLEFAQAIHNATAPGDLILSNVPNPGAPIEFYAERLINWGIMPDAAAQRADRAAGAVYYAICGDDPALLMTDETLSEVAINPACRLARLR